MSAGLNKTKHRIASVKSTRKITKAMEMVASVKLRRFRNAFDSGDLYGEYYDRLMSEIFKYSKNNREFLPREKGNGKTLYLVVTSNLGLCAAYNSNIYKYVESIIDHERDSIAPIGNKGAVHFPYTGKYQMDDSFSFLELSSGIEDIARAGELVKKLYLEGTYDKIVMIYTKYVNSLRFEPTSWQLLPVNIDPKFDPDLEPCPPLFEPSPDEMLSKMMDGYIASIISGKLTESQLSEQASRRNAMESATDNADELLDKLTIQYNKARQSSITNEITEVVAGANAQK